MIQDFIPKKYLVIYHIKLLRFKIENYLIEKKDNV